VVTKSALKKGAAKKTVLASAAPANAAQEKSEAKIKKVEA